MKADTEEITMKKLEFGLMRMPLLDKTNAADVSLRYELLEEDDEKILANHYSNALHTDAFCVCLAGKQGY